MINVSFTVFSLMTVYFTYAEYGEVAKQKCHEYAKAVFVRELDFNNEVHEISECGITSVPLIVGGEEASEKEFPHMALIGFGESPDDHLSWSCGGSLISENFILTAAHCLTSQEFGLSQKVRLGVLITDELDEEIMQELAVIGRLKHPEYVRPARYNDIGLLRLDGQVNFTPYVRPACINTETEYATDKMTAIGFGKLTYSSRNGSKHLMKVDLPLIKQSECKRYFPSDRAMPKGLVSQVMCAGDLKGGKDTCQGDSGGPLNIVLDEPYCMYNILGIVSFGRFCGFPNSPSVYTNVAYFVPWIERIVWGGKGH